MNTAPNNTQREAPLHLLTEADLDAHIADREAPFYSPHYRPTASREIVWTRSGVGIGAAHVRPAAPMSDEAIRIQSLLMHPRTARNEQRTGAEVWRNAEIAAAKDEHVQAMARTHRSAWASLSGAELAVVAIGIVAVLGLLVGWLA